MSLRIGIDGGGSKTELILVDESGAIIAQHIGPGCNPSLLGPDKARATLVDALQHLLAQSPRPGVAVDATLLCMAGAPTFWQETSAGLTGYGRIVAVLDSLPVLELATAGGPGLVMHAGTGSFISARAPDGTVHYAGGLGWLFGDPGSGHDLGRRALARGLRELQGWAPRTALGDRIRSYTGIEVYGAISRSFYTAADANARIAGFTPHLLELAQAGNEPAQQVLIESLTGLVEQGEVVTARLFGNQATTCGVSGAILNHPAAAATLRNLVASRSWAVSLSFITATPIEGVRRLLTRL
ncbi:MAG: ATPase [Opitutaceae bacterium]|nr:ATPase [Opitutaceae bacterium]